MGRMVGCRVIEHCASGELAHAVGARRALRCAQAVRLALAGLLGSACAAGDSPDGSGFASFGGPGQDGAAADEGSSGSDSGEGSSGSSEGSAQTDPATDSGPASGESSPLDDAGDAPTTEGGASGAQSTDEGTSDGDPTTGGDDGVPSGSQPTMGMYAHCVEGDFSKCAPANACVYLGDDGFCTVQGCGNPAVDCDPAPAGTLVTPICVDAVSTALCALDCSSSACPPGMLCTTMSINMGPQYDICV